MHNLVELKRAKDPILVKQKLELKTVTLYKQCCKGKWQSGLASVLAHSNVCSSSLTQTVRSKRPHNVSAQKV